jgi:hypothetical protein
MTDVVGPWLLSADIVGKFAWQAVLHLRDITTMAVDSSL